MNHDLAKELKDAGYPQEPKPNGGYLSSGKIPFRKDEPIKISDNELYYYPTLSELIEACGDIFYGLRRLERNEWVAYIFDIDDSTRQVEGKGTTPEEAVARLWLVLNEK